MVNRTLANIYKPLRGHERATKRTTRAMICKSVAARNCAVSVLLIDKAASDPDMIQGWIVVYSVNGGESKNVTIHSERLSDMAPDEWSDDFYKIAEVEE